MTVHNSDSNSYSNSENEEQELTDIKNDPELQETGVDKPVQKSLRFDGWLYREMMEEMAAENITDFTSFTLNKVTRSYQQAARIKELERFGTDEALKLQAELATAENTIKLLRAEILESTANEEIQNLQDENQVLRDIIEEYTWMTPTDINEILCNS